MKSQIFLFIKVALSGREAAERFSISLFLQSNWGARKWSGPLCFLFCHDEKENSIVFVFDIVIVFVTAGTCLYHCLWYNLDRCSPGKYHIVACMHQMFLWQMAFFCKKTNFFSGRFMLAAILCMQFLSYFSLIIIKSQSLEDAFFSMKGGTLYWWLWQKNWYISAGNLYQILIPDMSTQ